jgi:hypothetical protein
VSTPDEALTALMTRVPPNGLEFERAVLGAALLDRDAAARVATECTDADFYKEGHRIILRAIQALQRTGQAVDGLLIQDALQRSGELDEVGGPAVFAALAEEGSTASQTPAYLARLHELAALRESIKVCGELVGGAYEDRPAVPLLTDALAALEQWQRYAAATATVFPALPLGAFLRSDVPDPAWLVEGLIPAGTVSLMVGDSESYKSWLGVLLTVSVAAGQPLLGHYPVQSAPTLLISEENGVAEDKRRVRQICLGLGIDPETAPCYIASDTGFNFDDPEAYAALRAFIDAHGVKLVTTDALVRVHRRDENTAGEMGALYLERLKPLNKAGVGVNLIHHKPKPKERNGAGPPPDSADVRGSGDIRAQAHSVLTLRTVRQDGATGTVLVRHSKSRGAPRQDPFIVRVGDSEDKTATLLTWGGAPEQALDPLDGCREALLLFAAEKGQFARKDLGTQLKGRYSRKVWEPVLTALAKPGGPLTRELRGKAHWFTYNATGDPGASDELPF